MIRNVCITCVIWLEGECAARVRWPRLKVLHYHKLAVKDWSILLPSEIILGSVAKQRQWCNFSWWLKMFFPHFAQLALPASYCLGRKGSCGNFCTFHNLDNALCFHAIFLGIVHCAQTQWLLCRHTHNCKIFTEAIASVIYILATLLKGGGTHHGEPVGITWRHKQWNTWSSNWAHTCVYS